MKERHDLALFDFDGTVTTRDTFIDLLYHLHGRIRFWWGMLMLSPYTLLFFAKKMPNYQLKERFLTYYFGGMSTETFKQVVKEYTEEKMPKILRKTMLERIEWHKKRGDRVIVVSASLTLWLTHFTEINNIELIATEAEIVNNTITGKLATKNCHGPQKVKRVKEFLNTSEYNEIWAYGDSRGDKEMLEMADHPFFRIYTFD